MSSKLKMSASLLQWQPEPQHLLFCPDGMHVTSGWVMLAIWGLSQGGAWRASPWGERDSVMCCHCVQKAFNSVAHVTFMSDKQSQAAWHHNRRLRMQPLLISISVLSCGCTFPVAVVTWCLSGKERHHEHLRCWTNDSQTLVYKWEQACVLCLNHIHTPQALWHHDLKLLLRMSQVEKFKQIKTYCD